MQQRDLLTSTTDAPPWLCENRSNAQRFLAVIGTALDALLEKQDEGAAAKCPVQGEDPSLIPLQAADRVFVQGPAETNAQFITRMQGAYDAWARAGSRPAVLEQVQAYLSGQHVGVAASLPECLIVGGSTSSVWDVLTIGADQGAAPARRVVSSPSPNWDWDSNFTRGQAWLVLFMHLVPTGQSGATGNVVSTGGSGVAGVTTGFAQVTGLLGMTASNVQQYITVSGAASSANNGTFQIVAVPSDSSVLIANPRAVAPDANNGSLVWSVGAYPFIGPAPVWGSPSFVWGAGTWGVNCSSQIITSIRQLVQRWKSASTYYPNIIISFGGGDGTAGNEFSPLSTTGAGNPDGTWGRIGENVGGAWVAAKQPLNPFTAFCGGTGVSVSCYEKNRT